MDVEDDGEVEEEEEEETTQIAAGEPEELHRSVDNQEDVCGASAEELPDETEENESNLGLWRRFSLVKGKDWNLTSGYWDDVSRTYFAVLTCVFCITS